MGVGVGWITAGVKPKALSLSSHGEETVNHGHFPHKCHVVGWPLWAIRAHSSSPLLLIHSRSAPLSVPKLSGDLYAQSSPAFPEQGLSAQEMYTHWAPG